MNFFLTKLPGPRRIHIASLACASGTVAPTQLVRPLCGGGHGARAVQWQQDIGPCDCAACRKIAQRQNTQVSNPPPKKNPRYENVHA